MNTTGTFEHRVITDGHILQGIAQLGTPMLIGALLQNLQSLIDLFWVGGLGAPAVAALAMSGTVLMVLFPMLMGISTGTLALVSRAIGGNRPAEASEAASQSMLLAIVLGALTGLIGWFCSSPLFRWLGAEPDVIAMAGNYLRISMLGSFTVFALFTSTAALQGAGDTMTPMVIMAIANALNVVLDPILIYGLGTLPGAGVSGAAWATVISQAIAALISVRILFAGKAHIRIRLEQWKPNLRLAWRILRIGLPGSGQMLSRSLMGAVMMWIVASCGTAAVAAYGIGLRFHMIMLMPAFALGGAAATMVGQNLGAGKPERAYHAAWLATGLDMIIMVAFTVIIALWAPSLIRFFNHEHDVILIGSRYLRIVSPFYVFAAMGIVLGRALNGAGDSLAPMIVTIVSLWCMQVPLALWYSHVWQPATHGIWWAIAVAMTLNGLLIAGWFETGRWKDKRV